jgi:outer membrane receptor protein involved in Fe transport
LWGSPGAAQGGYSKFQNGQFRLTGSSNFDIEDHSLIVGFEYEQRTDRAYSLNATGLWNQMRLLQNKPNQELDLSNPIYVRDENGVFQDTINYNYIYSPNDASRFAENARSVLGLDPLSTEQINILNMDPSLFSLDFFSADELINPGGISYVNYYGYDYTGQIMNENVTVADFFSARDENGDLSRPIAAFQPIYMAGYIQDKFTFRDLVFNVGVRVDRFDLNQEVLKDPFVLFPTYRVRDLAQTELSGSARESVPSSIGQDYVVYINSFDYENASIVGYRNPENNLWFDANGDPLANPQQLSDAAGGGIKPLLVTPPSVDSEASKTLTSASFEDYKPQVVIMPRIAFNFPISDEALFMAHYDVLAQRPLAATSRSNPFDYLNLLNRDAGGILSNPNLKPQITTEYELGFKQALTERSTLKLSAFYREFRDLVQTTAFTQAYPITYIAFTNVDFSTTKGFSFEYEMNRTNNISMRANYTLQFADGTGSSANSGFNLANSGQPNLRYILPLNFDTRHQISVLGDFRYGYGARYNGPVWWNKRVFQNAGINMTMNAFSGNPYTKRVDFRPNAQIDGQVNGARLPWQMTFDAKVNKVFSTRNGKHNFEVYLQILNVFNTRNIVDVYDFTGSADDNGFLSSTAAAAQLTQQTNAQSYVDLYNRSINNPGNYGLPRRVRLGVTYSF